MREGEGKEGQNEVPMHRENSHCDAMVRREVQVVMNSVIDKYNKNAPKHKNQM